MLTLVEQLELKHMEQEMMLESGRVMNAVKAVLKAVKKYGWDVPISLISKAWQKWVGLFKTVESDRMLLYKKLLSELKKAQTMYNQALKTRSPNDPLIKDLEKEIKALRKQIEEIKNEAKVTTTSKVFATVTALFIVTMISLLAAGSAGDAKKRLKAWIESKKNKKESKEEESDTLLSEAISLLEAETEEKKGAIKKIFGFLKQYGWEVPVGFIVKYFNKLYKMSPDQLNSEWNKLYNTISKLKAENASDKKIAKLEEKLKKVGKNITKVKEKGSLVNWKNVIITAIIVMVVAGAVVYFYKKKKKAQQNQ